jgi:hypothetical protein
MQAVLKEGGIGALNPLQLVTGAVAAVQQYFTWEQFVPDLKLSVSIWVPLHYINFSFVPLEFRLPFMAGVGFMWAFALSYCRGGDVEAMNSGVTANASDLALNSNGADDSDSAR